MRFTTLPPHASILTPRLWIALGLVALPFATACSGCDDPADDGLGGSGSSSDATSSGSDQGGGPTTSISVVASVSGSSGGDPCATVDCDPGTRCEVADGEASCVAITCEEADCSATEECVEQPNGGHVCVDNSCEDDVDCPEDRWCDGEVCVDDVCEAGSARCDGDELIACSENGGAEEPKFTCGSDAYFESECVDDGDAVFCGCQDDWDCPEFTVCDVGQCVGTGVEPTCKLPPLPFDQLLPAPEIVWGGAGIGDTFATDSPFERSAQVVMTPLVINLDDDNGDGLVNERDFPEILFVSFCNSEFTTNGTLRAIHGGGPDKGTDYFAVCGADVWHEGDPAPTTCAAETANNCGAATLNSTASIAAGDLDGDGLPEIVVVTEDRRLQIHGNDGTILSTSAASLTPAGNPGPTIANLDGEGYAEIVIGNVVFTLMDDGNGNPTMQDRFVGNEGVGSNGQGPVSCVADVLGDERQEIVAGATAYLFPNPPAGATTIADCAANPPQNAEETAFCDGELVVQWDTPVAGGNDIEGFCAVADIFGATLDVAPGPDNPLDGEPEVVLVSRGRILVLDGETGALRENINFNADPQNPNLQGGPPNIDDFDGDGFPEVGTAFSTSYKVIDFQEPSAACPAWDDVLVDDVDLGDGPQSNPARTPPDVDCETEADCSAVTPGTTCNTTLGRCVCLHNNWERMTEDDSSQVTGSSVFDFNGDGGAEVVYNDECYFRIYDGVGGRVLFKEPSESRTRIEYPIVADADNDGNAEIVFPTTNESGFCSENEDAEYNNGIEMWGDPSDQWVSARRVWNQHAYHVTNVLEGGGIPAHEPESWSEWNGRRYNTYRSNPRSFGVAPDLVVAAVQVSSPDATCGELSDTIEITARIANIGDLRVGPGVIVAFRGTWDAGLENLEDAAGDPIVVQLQQSLEPGDSTFVTVTYDSTVHDPAELPQSVTVVVDDTELENECVEDNNETTEDVEAGDALADLRIDVGAVAGCPDPTVAVTVTNEGAAPASDVLVRLYAGDPSQGGLVLEEETIAGPLAPGDSVDLDVVLSSFPSSQSIVVWGVVDPDDTIPECDDADNRDPADDAHSCGGPN
jgi:hypothetical protein